MVGGPAPVVTRARTVAGGLAVLSVAVALAWLLARPSLPVAEGMLRAVADCAAVVTLGLAVVGWLDVDRHRQELTETAARSLIVAAAAWAVAELARLPVSAADAAGVPVLRVGVGTTVEFAVHTAPGRAGLVCVAAAAVVCAASWSTVTVARPGPAATVVVPGAAAVGFTGRSLVGHLSGDPWGGLAVAVHALAAALWCGTLAALVLTVGHRGRWSRVLPRFSQLSLACVVVLVVGGAVGGAVALTSPTQLWSTGYGRLLAAKVVLTVVLVALGWRNRTVWLPAARTHRATALVSRTRSRVELAGMGVALALAAALAVTG